MARKKKKRRVGKLTAPNCPKCGQYMDKIVGWVCRKCGRLKKRR